MNVTCEMMDAMEMLKARLADALDDDYSDVMDDVMCRFALTDAQSEYVEQNYLDF